MRALLCSAVLAVSVLAMPASAAPRQVHVSFDGPPLPPGCFQIYPDGPIFCVDMPIE
jgi:hypothetical protein